jgi:hypothetical protein
MKLDSDCFLKADWGMGAGKRILRITRNPENSEVTDLRVLKVWEGRN